MVMTGLEKKIFKKDINGKGCIVINLNSGICSILFSVGGAQAFYVPFLFFDRLERARVNIAEWWTINSARVPKLRCSIKLHRSRIDVIWKVVVIVYDTVCILASHHIGSDFLPFSVTFSI
ncbi:unnamed protein product [Sphenostylis stenocarpa]|uniref:Uncharacterized protein n=1 Tax=Sphenostylis stenocarpa TaxID=92480 RepID=A0AA86W1P1_9FABA|nr:unnamed protein product [Sphenostylis stenocarpa]